MAKTRVENMRELGWTDEDTREYFRMASIVQKADDKQSEHIGRGGHDDIYLDLLTFAAQKAKNVMDEILARYGDK